MATTYTKEDDYTLRVDNELADIKLSANFSGKQTQKITRLFNFLAGQVTTIENSSLYSIGKEARAAASSSSVTVQNFRDIQSDREIRFMHEKLVALGGKPPSIEEVLTKLPSKPRLGNL